MNTQNLFDQLDANTGNELTFILSDGRKLEGDLHFTEVKSVNVKSMDCGSNAHTFNETIIQLWLNEQSEKKAQWTVEKAANILNKVRAKQPIDHSSEVFFEFGDSKTQTSKFSIESMNREGEKLVIRLYVKPTVCKPRFNNELACC